MLTTPLLRGDCDPFTVLVHSFNHPCDSIIPKTAIVGGKYTSITHGDSVRPMCHSSTQVLLSTGIPGVTFGPPATPNPAVLIYLSALFIRMLPCQVEGIEPVVVEAGFRSTGTQMNLVTLIIHRVMSDVKKTNKNRIINVFIFF